MKKQSINIPLSKRPKLVNRPRCWTFKLEGGCRNCGGNKFRYYALVQSKKYYQCEKCRMINH